MKKITHFSLTCLLLFALMFTSVQAVDFNKNNAIEVRVLVDVSERMKISDPENHRISALKLFINLLPNNANVGIWMFCLLYTSDAADE